MLENIAATAWDILLSIPDIPQVLFDNMDDVPSGQHIRATLLPGDTQSIGVTAIDMQVGYFQISVFVSKGVGVLGAMRYCSTILAYFPRNLQTEFFRVNTSGSIGPGLYTESWYYIPVTIPYLQIK